MNITTGKEQRYSGTAQQRDLEQAMEHFGLGASKETQEKAFIIARVDRWTIKTMWVRPMKITTGTFGKSRELMREMCNTDYFNVNDDALISLPRIMVAKLGLYEYTLDEDEIDYYRRKVEKYIGMRF